MLFLAQTAAWMSKRVVGTTAPHVGQSESDGPSTGGATERGLAAVEPTAAVLGTSDTVSENGADPPNPTTLMK